MRAIGIELCDAGILATSLGSREERIVNLEADSTDSPAYVIFDGQSYICGKEAENICRIHPRIVSDTCWDQLSLRKSGIDANGKTPVYSELAYHHLKHIWTRIQSTQKSIDKVVLATPGDYLNAESGNDEKVGLLLGMAVDLGMPLTGLIDMACASILPQAHALANSQDVVLHLDLHQHAAIITLVHLSDNLHSQKVIRTSSLGYAQILADLVPKLANRFLSQTAFDVSHNAQTEQAFFNQAVALLRKLGKTPEATIQLEGKKRPRKMVISRDTIARFLDGITNQLTQIAIKAAGGKDLDSKPKLLAITERARRIPGLKEQLENAGGFKLISLPEGAAAFGAARFGLEAPVVKDLTETPLITRISLGKINQGSTSAEPAAIGSAARQTHSGKKTPSARSAAGSTVAVAIEEKPSEVVTASKDQTGHIPTHIVMAGVAHPLDLKDGFLIGTSIPAENKGLSIPKEYSGAANLHCRIFSEKGCAKLQTQTPGETYLNKKPVKGEVAIRAGDVLTMGTGKNRLDLMFVFYAKS